MARKAKILVILLVFCLLAAVYAPAVSAARGNDDDYHPSEKAWENRMLAGHHNPVIKQAPHTGTAHEISPELKKKLEDEKRKNEEAIAYSIGK